MRLHPRGFALILVLIACAGLFALGAHAAVTTRAATIEARVLLERTSAARDARSAAAIFLASLSTTPQSFAARSGSAAPNQASADPPSDEPKEPEIELPPLIKELIGDSLKDVQDKARDEISAQNAVQGGGISGRATANTASKPAQFTSLPTSPVPVRVRKDSRPLMVSVSDAWSGLNVNESTHDELLRFFTASDLRYEVASALADQIIDWRDADSTPLPSGAEQPAYTPRAIACRNAPLTTLEELLFLPAMTRDIFSALRADLTTAGDNRVHVGSASRRVLLALPNMDPEIVDAIINARNEAPITEKILDRLIPIRARETRDRLRVEPASLVRIRVEPIPGDPGPTYEGLVLLGATSSVEALGLRPILN